MGQRILLQAQDKPTSPEGEQETEGIQYKSWRIEHGVAEGDTEMPSGITSLCAWLTQYNPVLFQSVMPLVF